MIQDITEFIDRFPETSLRFVFGDFTQEATLNRASISKASAVIVLADCGPDGAAKADDRTLLAVLAVKAMTQDVRICVELIEPTNEVHLRRAGVDQIVLGGEFSGFMLASSVMSPGIPQALKEMVFMKMGSDIRREAFPGDMIGMRFGEAVSRYLERSGSVLLGVITEKKSFNLATILQGKDSAIDDFIRRKFDEAGRDLSIESKGRLSVSLNPGREYIITDEDFAVVLTPRQESAV